MPDWTKKSAFAHFGAVSKNPRWSWSARTPDDAVVLAFWRDKLDYSVSPPLYSDRGWATEETARHPGNLERIENIKLALEKNDGIVAVVIAVAADPEAAVREIASCHPQKRLRMKIVAFDPETGEFDAAGTGED